MVLVHRRRASSYGIMTVFVIWLARATPMSISISIRVTLPGLTKCGGANPYQRLWRFTKAVIPRGEFTGFLGASQFYAHTDVTADNQLINKVWQRVLGKTAPLRPWAWWRNMTPLIIFYPKKGLSLQGEYRFTALFSAATIITISCRWMVNTFYRWRRP